jgi:hypothetical protein
LSAGLSALAPLALAAVAASAPSPPALRVEAGSVVRQQMVAIGRDLVVEGEALADLAALDGSVALTGHAAGDVIVLGGDARLESGARVDGSVFVLGGTLQAAPGASIGGRAVSYPSMSAAWLTLLEGPTLGLASTSPIVLGAKLALLAAWTTLLLVLFAASGRQVLATSEVVRDEPLRCFVTGLTGVLALVLTALFFSAFAGALVGLPLLVLVVVAALLLKLWGMVAVFHAAGFVLARAARRRRWLPLHVACLGLLALGALKLVPWLGTLVWTAATLIGVGAALLSKFGRREPWFAGAEALPASS